MIDGIVNASGMRSIVSLKLSHLPPLVSSHLGLVCLIMEEGLSKSYGGISDIQVSEDTGVFCNSTWQPNVYAKYVHCIKLYQHGLNTILS